MLNCRLPTKSADSAVHQHTEPVPLELSNTSELNKASSSELMTDVKRRGVRSEMLDRYNVHFMHVMFPSYLLC